MTLRCASPHASLTSTISSKTVPNSPDRNAPRSMTMSISSAPASTAARVSAILMSRKVWPLGNPVATLATRTALPARASLASATRAGYTHTAATDGMVGSPGLGRMALAHMARTLPGVSFPSRVVRSIIRIARSSAHSFDAFLIDRFLSESTRASTPTWSTVETRPSRLPSGSPIERDRPSHARISSLARSRARVSGRLVAVMGRRGYATISRRQSLAAAVHLRQGRHAAFALDQVVAEPVEHDAQVLDAAERSTGTRQLVGLLWHPQQPYGTPEGAQHREERLGLPDGRADIALGVLDEQRCVDGVGIGERRDLAVIRWIAPRRSLELER